MRAMSSIKGKRVRCEEELMPRSFVAADSCYEAPFWVIQRKVDGASR